MILKSQKPIEKLEEKPIRQKESKEKRMHQEKRDDLFQLLSKEETITLRNGINLVVSCERDSQNIPISLFIADYGLKREIEEKRKERKLPIPNCTFFLNNLYEHEKAGSDETLQQLKDHCEILNHTLAKLEGFARDEKEIENPAYDKEIKNPPFSEKRPHISIKFVDFSPQENILENYLEDHYPHQKMVENYLEDPFFLTLDDLEDPYLLKRDKMPKKASVFLYCFSSPRDPEICFGSENIKKYPFITRFKYSIFDLLPYHSKPDRSIIEFLQLTDFLYKCFGKKKDFKVWEDFVKDNLQTLLDNPKNFSALHLTLSNVSAKPTRNQKSIYGTARSENVNAIFAQNARQSNHDQVIDDKDKLKEKDENLFEKNPAGFLEWSLIKSMFLFTVFGTKLKNWNQVLRKSLQFEDSFLFESDLPSTADELVIETFSRYLKRHIEKESFISKNYEDLFLPYLKRDPKKKASVSNKASSHFEHFLPDKKCQQNVTEGPNGRGTNGGDYLTDVVKCKQHDPLENQNHEKICNFPVFFFLMIKLGKLEAGLCPKDKEIIKIFLADNPIKISQLVNPPSSSMGLVPSIEVMQFFDRDSIVWEPILKKNLVSEEGASAIYLYLKTKDKNFPAKPLDIDDINKIYIHNAHLITYHHILREFIKEEEEKNYEKEKGIESSEKEKKPVKKEKEKKPVDMREILREILSDGYLNDFSEEKVKEKIRELSREESRYIDYFLSGLKLGNLSDGDLCKIYDLFSGIKLNDRLEQRECFENLCQLSKEAVQFTALECNSLNYFSLLDRKTTAYLNGFPTSGFKSYLGFQSPGLKDFSYLLKEYSPFLQEVNHFVPFEFFSPALHFLPQPFSSFQSEQSVKTDPPIPQIGSATTRKEIVDNTFSQSSNVRSEEEDNKKKKIFSLQQRKNLYGTVNLEECLKDLVYPIGLPTVYAKTASQEGFTLKGFIARYQKKFFPHLWKIIVSGKLTFKQDLLLNNSLEDLAKEREEKYQVSETKVGKGLSQSNSFLATSERSSPSSHFTDTFYGAKGTIFPQSVKHKIKNVQNLTYAREDLLEKKRMEDLSYSTIKSQYVENAVITQDLLKVLQKICSRAEMGEIYNLQVETAVFWDKGGRVQNIQDWYSQTITDKGSFSFQEKEEMLGDSRTRKWYSVEISKEFINPLIENARLIQEENKKQGLKGCEFDVRFLVEAIYRVFTGGQSICANVVLADIITARTRIFFWLTSKSLHVPQTYLNPIPCGLEWGLLIKGSARKPSLQKFVKPNALIKHRNINKINKNALLYDLKKEWAEWENPSKLSTDSENTSQAKDSNQITIEDLNEINQIDDSKIKEKFLRKFLVEAKNLDQLAERLADVIKKYSPNFDKPANFDKEDKKKKAINKKEENLPLEPSFKKESKDQENHQKKDQEKDQEKSYREQLKEILKDKVAILKKDKSGNIVRNENFVFIKNKEGTIKMDNSVIDLIVTKLSVKQFWDIYELKGTTPIIMG